jgi:hypothetical protein
MCSCSGGKEEPGLFVSEEAGFSIKFPEQWVIYEEVGNWIPVVEGESPLDDEEDGFSEYVAVDVETLPSKMSVDEYFDSFRKQLAAESRNFEQHEEGEVKIDGTKARYILYDKEMPEAFWRILAYVMVKNGKGYVINCAAENQQFARHYEAMMDIAHTFEFE